MRPRIACHRRVASSGVVGLAERLAGELEHRVAAQHHRVRREVVAAGHRRALELGQLEGELGRGEVPDLVLVDAGHDHHRLDTGAAQRLEPGGGGGREHERHGERGYSTVSSATFFSRGRSCWPSSTWPVAHHIRRPRVGDLESGQVVVEPRALEQLPPQRRLGDLRRAGHDMADRPGDAVRQDRDEEPQPPRHRVADRGADGLDDPALHAAVAAPVAAASAGPRRRSCGGRRRRGT